MEEESLLYDLIASKYLYDIKDKLYNDRNDNFTRWLKSSREALEKALNKEQLELVDTYEHILKTDNEYVELLVGVKFLNLGVKIGMQLQKAFDEE